MEEKRFFQGVSTCVRGVGMGLFMVLAAPVAAAPTAKTHSQSTPMVSDTLTMYAGQALVRRAPGPLRRVAIGDGKLIQVKTIGRNEMVLIADSPGDTTMHLWMRNGSQRNVDVHIVPGDTDQAAKMVGQLLGDSPAIRIQSIGGHVVLTGDGLSQVQMQHIKAIKKLYPQVLDLTSANAAPAKPMVMMQVRIMEFDKNAMNQLGIKWDSSINGPAGGLVHDWKTNSLYRIPQTFEGAKLPLQVSGTAAYFGIATSIASRIDLMSQTGNAAELAAPQLSARSGGVADFLAGGQVPIPTSSAFGQTNVQYKDYGIKLHIAPVVGSNGEISADIQTEVSSIDPTVQVGPYPGFKTRRASAEVNVRQGQTIVISGLVDAKASKFFNAVPGLGNIPILGALFRSRDFQSKRTDLVIFVTPYVVDANSPRNRALIKKSNRLRNNFRKTIGSDIVN